VTELDLSPRDTPEVPVRSRRRRNWLPMIVLGLVLVAGGVIVTRFLTSAVDYYCNVDEIGKRAGCNADRRIRLQGTVEQNSVKKSGETTMFTIAFHGAAMPVTYDGQPGGIFKECVPVVVHGIIRNGVLLGDQVEVKHSEKYAADNGDRLKAADEAGCPSAASANAASP
jgi:cytochrome c-type biogenesis protein CcmE